MFRTPCICMHISLSYSYRFANAFRFYLKRLLKFKQKFEKKRKFTKRKMMMKKEKSFFLTLKKSLLIWILYSMCMWTCRPDSCQSIQANHVVIQYWNNNNNNSNNNVLDCIYGLSSFTLTFLILPFNFAASFLLHFHNKHTSNVHHRIFFFL